MGSSSPNRVENKKYLKPPPSIPFILMDGFFPQKSKGPIQHSQQEQLFFFGVHVHMCLAGDRPGVASGKSHFCWKRMAMMKPLSREATKWAHVTTPISRIVYMTRRETYLYRAKNSRKKLAGVHFVKPGTGRFTGKGEVQSDSRITFRRPYLRRRSTPSRDFSRILKASPPQTFIPQ